MERPKFSLLKDEAKWYIENGYILYWMLSRKKSGETEISGDVDTMTDGELGSVIRYGTLRHIYHKELIDKLQTYMPEGDIFDVGNFTWMQLEEIIDKIEGTNESDRDILNMPYNNPVEKISVKEFWEEYGI